MPDTSSQNDKIHPHTTPIIWLDYNPHRNTATRMQLYLDYMAGILHGYHCDDPELQDELIAAVAVAESISKLNAALSMCAVAFGDSHVWTAVLIQPRSTIDPTRRTPP